MGSVTGAESAAAREGRKWLITGVCGSVGRRLLDKVLAQEPERVVCFDNNESELFLLYEDFRNDHRVNFFCGDVRDRGEIEARIAGCDFVLHVAGMKHVFLCEQSPGVAINTNILGTQIILEAAISHGVERVLFTSSDKAVNPTNVMGASKLMAERLVSASNARSRKDRQVFASTRFGNVLGSRGSVVPVFVKQIRSGGPVTVTDPDMTRFVMTVDEAAQLVIDSVFIARGGEIFVTKMPVARIGDLAEIMIEELAGKFGFEPRDIRIEEIGPRPGEKLFEELMTDDEAKRALELSRYFVVPPAVLSKFRDIDYSYADAKPPLPSRKPYNSSTAQALSKKELRNYLIVHGAIAGRS